MKTDTDILTDWIEGLEDRVTAMEEAGLENYTPREILDNLKSWRAKWILSSQTQPQTATLSLLQNDSEDFPFEILYKEDGINSICIGSVTLTEEQQKYLSDSNVLFIGHKKYYSLDGVHYFHSATEDEK